MKKALLYLAIFLLLIACVVSMILKYKYENDFMLNRYESLNTLMTNIDQLDSEQKEEIGKIASNYKYRIYTYNSVAVLTFATSILLFLRRKKMLS